MPVFQERKYNLNIFCSYYREIDVHINIGYILFQVFFLDVFSAALFVHELDKHELFGVHIVGHTLWCGTIIVVFFNKLYCQQYYDITT